MDVYLVRHAIAEERDPARWPDDAERPLSPRGADRFRHAARGLRRIAPEVEAVVTSPCVRARQTAEILRDETGWPIAELSGGLAEGEPEAAIRLIEERRRRASVALVGHEPQLSRLAALLLGGTPDSFVLDLKKGGVVLLSLLDCPVPGGALLRFSAAPALLRAAGR
jgi:phosphohistidine phosphatase